MYHACGEGPRCRCHGKTEAELARPYALFAFSLPLVALVALLIFWIVQS
jgi:hypothetical protein